MAPALAEGAMDVGDLAPALLATSDLLQLPVKSFMEKITKSKST